MEKEGNKEFKMEADELIWEFMKDSSERKNVKNPFLKTAYRSSSFIESVVKELVTCVAKTAGCAGQNEQRDRSFAIGRILGQLARHRMLDVKVLYALLDIAREFEVILSSDSSEGAFCLSCEILKGGQFVKSYSRTLITNRVTAAGLEYGCLCNECVVTMLYNRTTQKLKGVFAILEKRQSITQSIVTQLTRNYMNGTLPVSEKDTNATVRCDQAERVILLASALSSSSQLHRLSIDEEFKYTVVQSFDRIQNRGVVCFPTFVRPSDSVRDLISSSFVDTFFSSHYARDRVVHWSLHRFNTSRTVAGWPTATILAIMIAKDGVQFLEKHEGSFLGIQRMLSRAHQWPDDTVTNKLINVLAAWCFKRNFIRFSSTNNPGGMFARDVRQRVEEWRRARTKWLAAFLDCADLPKEIWREIHHLLSITTMSFKPSIRHHGHKFILFGTKRIHED